MGNMEPVYLVGVLIYHDVPKRLSIRNSTIQKSLIDIWISQDVQHGEKEYFWEYAWVGHQPLRSIQALDIIRKVMIYLG